MRPSIWIGQHCIGRVDGFEVKQKEFEAGGFSDTTTMDGKVIFDIGAVDYSLSSETKTEAGNH